MARPLMLTDEARAAIVEAVAAGLPRKFAAQKVGVTDRALYKWLARGRKGGKGSGPFVRLVHEVKKAEAEAVARNVDIIQTAAKTTWTAAAWWLERRYPGHFGKKEQLTTRRHPNDLGAGVRSRVDEVDREPGGQPGEAGGGDAGGLADPPAPAAG